MPNNFSTILILFFFLYFLHNKWFCVICYASHERVSCSYVFNIKKKWEMCTHWSITFVGWGENIHSITSTHPPHVAYEHNKSIVMRQCIRTYYLLFFFHRVCVAEKINETPIYKGKHAENVNFNNIPNNVNIFSACVFFKSSLE